LIIIQDQREKHGHHNLTERYCKINNIPIVRKRLEVGDYMLGEVIGDKIVPIGKKSIDGKQDLCELANDLYRDKKEFNKKYRKCYEQGIQLYVLVEQEIKSVNDILSWKSAHSKISGKMLYDMIERVRKSYGVKFLFCKKEYVAQTIINILSS
jgi:hypothetical protein